MSSFRQQQTTINDAKVLEATLTKMGYKPSVTGSKQEVRGHYNETRTADIILRKEDLKQGGDIGFSQGKDGNFSIVADTYVMKNFSLEKFQKEVNTKYVEEKTMKLARHAGLTFVGRQVTKTGAVKLNFTKA